MTSSPELRELVEVNIEFQVDVIALIERLYSMSKDFILIINCNLVVVFSCTV